jgi:hypothetical protein
MFRWSTNHCIISWNRLHSTLLGFSYGRRWYDNILLTLYVICCLTSKSLSWKANARLVGRQSSSFLWNTKVHYTNSSLFPVIRKTNHFYTIILHCSRELNKYLLHRRPDRKVMLLRMHKSPIKGGEHLSLLLRRFSGVSCFLLLRRLCIVIYLCILLSFLIVSDRANVLNYAS